MTTTMSAVQLMREIWGDDVPVSRVSDAALDGFDFDGFAEAVGAAVAKAIAEASTTTKMPETSAHQQGVDDGVEMTSDEGVRFAAHEASGPGCTLFSWSRAHTTHGVEATYTSNVAASSSSASSPSASGVLGALWSVLGWSVFGDSS